MITMKHLSKFKLVAVAQKQVQSKAEHRRAKLIEKLEDQLAMAEALIKGENFRKFKQVWGHNEHGDRIRLDREKRIRAWYWMNAAGCYFSVFYGSRVIKLEGDNTAITVGSREKLPEIIRAVIEAVKAGELDKNIEEVADKGIYTLNSKSTSKTNMKALKATG
jgi:hypothetical protein